MIVKLYNILYTQEVNNHIVNQLYFPKNLFLMFIFSTTTIFFILSKKYKKI